MGNLQKFLRNQVWWQKSTNKPLTPGIQSDKRPVLIISNNAGNRFSSVVTVVPLTTAVKKDLPTHVKILMETGIISTVLCEQIRTIPTETLCDYIGTVDESNMAEIDNAILTALGFTATAATAPILLIPKEDSVITEYNATPTITLNADPTGTDISVETTLDEVPDTNVGDISTKSRAKRFNRRETKMIRDYLKYHTTAETSKYFSKIYDIEYDKIYPRICNIKYKTKHK